MLKNRQRHSMKELEEVTVILEWYYLGGGSPKCQQVMPRNRRFGIVCQKSVFEGLIQLE